MDAKLTPEQERQRQTWQYRAVEATRGNTTKMGCIVLAILNKPAKNPPGFGPSCVINPEGIVLSNFVNSRGEMIVGAMVCEVQELVDNFRGLADHLRLDDAQRREMFGELRKWVSVDYRAINQPGDPLRPPG